MARVFKKRILLSNQPWMKKRRRRERTRDDKSQPNHIPLDLALDIVSRLPAKSIMRYQCVSKLWSSFITLPSFINSFTSRSTSRSPTLLVTFASGWISRYVFSFPQHHIPDGSTCSPFYSNQITNTNRKYLRSESIHGLILSPDLRIWNPTLNRFLSLPRPDKSRLSRNGWGSCLGRSSYFGYDPLEGKHKVLFMFPMEYTDQPQVLTLGGQESWRIIPKGRCPKHLPNGLYGRCFNGILYYRARRLGDSHDTIMSFDVKSENFNVINYPVEVGLSFSSFHIIHYEGRLALVTYDYPYYDVTLYILEDAHGHKWTRESFVLHLPYETVQMYYIQFWGTTDAGEFVFAPSDFYETFYTLYLDPRRKSTRKVFFEINMDDLRRRCGLDSINGKSTLQVFPNHIESLFSL